MCLCHEIVAVYFVMDYTSVCKMDALPNYLRRNNIASRLRISGLKRAHSTWQSLYSSHHNIPIYTLESLNPSSLRPHPSPRLCPWAKNTQCHHSILVQD